MSHLHFLLLFFFSLVFSCTPFPCSAAASQPLLIGVISFDTRFLDAQLGLDDGLNQLGFLSEHDVKYFIHDLQKDLSRIPALVRQLQEQHCDLIMTTTTPVILAVKEAQAGTGRIPVIFTMVADPVGSQVVPSLQRPGGNITGVSYNAFAMMPKRLELYREAFPSIQHIAIIYNHAEAWIADPVRELLLPAAESLGFKVTDYDVYDKESMLALSGNFDRSVQGVFMVPDPLAISFFPDLVAISRTYNLPIMVQDNILLEKGGVLGYSPSFYSIGQQAAAMAAKILSGTEPGRLSVQNPKLTRLVVSLKEAERLGVALPATFLANTDAIIR